MGLDLIVYMVNLLLIIISAALISILAQYCNKKLISEEPVGKVVITMYVLCFFIILGLIAIRRDAFQLNRLIMIIAAVNVLATYCLGRATKIGLAQSIILLPLSGVVTVILSAFFLGEWHLLDPYGKGGILTIIGLLLVLGSVVFFAISRKQNINSRIIWLFSILSFIFIWGITNFIIKYFAVHISSYNYLISWYSGAFLGSLVYFLRGRSGVFKFNFDFKKKLLYLFQALGTVGSMWAIFSSLSLAPATVVFPIYHFLFVVGVVLVALYTFNEKRLFGVKEWVGLGVGLIGVFLLLLVFSIQ